MKTMKKSATIVAIALAMTAVVALGASADETATVEIPDPVIEVYGEYGISAETLVKSFAELSWAEKAALLELQADEEIDPVLNGAIVSSLMAALPEGADAVRTRVAGTWYTHRVPEDDE